MRKTEIKIPTILGLLLLILSIGSGIFFIEHINTFTSMASPSIVPRELQITNITSTGFTISWLTDKKASGVVFYSDKQEAPSITILDDRDKDKKGVNKFLTHHVSIYNLKPSTNYYFKLVSDNKIFDNNGNPYQISTGPTIEKPAPAIEPAYGQVMLPSDQPATDALVYLQIANSSYLSTLVKESGNWLITLNTARTMNLTDYINPQTIEIEKIFIKYDGQNSSMIITDTNNDSPVPPITLGKTYDFRTQKQNEPSQLANEGFSHVLGESQKLFTPSFDVQIYQPSEAENLPFSKPLFKGSGIPGETIKITLESELFVDTTAVESDGTWSWTPPYDLSPGTHKLTVLTKNSDGQPITLTRSFNILPSGSQVLGEATPSATLIPTIALTLTPTITLQPSPTPTIFATITISPTLGPPPPVKAGNVLPTLILFIIGSLLLVMGVYQIIIY